MDISADRLIQRYLQGDTSILPLPSPYYLLTFKILDGPLLAPIPVMSTLDDVMIGAAGVSSIPSSMKGVEFQVDTIYPDPFFHHCLNHEPSREEIIRILGEWTERNGVHQVALVDIQGITDQDRIELMEAYAFVPVIAQTIEGTKDLRTEDAPSESNRKPMELTHETLD